jgi:hypothetical protein
MSRRGKAQSCLRTPQLPCIQLQTANPAMVEQASSLSRARARNLCYQESEGAYQNSGSPSAQPCSCFDTLSTNGVWFSNFTPSPVRPEPVEG